MEDHRTIGGIMWYWLYWSCLHWSSLRLFDAMVSLLKQGAGLITGRCVRLCAYTRNKDTERHTRILIVQ